MIILSLKNYETFWNYNSCFCYLQAQYDDVRCKCICPYDSKSNKTKNVWTVTVEPQEW